jgi:hypothetical protein
MNNEITAQPGQVGMTFQDDLPFEDWEEIGKRFGEATKRFSWALGDWLVYGGSKFKKRISTEIYQEAEKVTGVDRQSLFAFATVCRRIPHADRIPHLSFEHHQMIASIPNDERRVKWLNFISSSQSTPTKKLLKLSISCFPNDPKIITKEEYEQRNRKFGKDNYVPHLRGLISILRKTIPHMDEDEVEALKADTASLVALLEEL